VIRFGVFAFDRGQLTLTREGRPVRLQPQPALVLAALLDATGRLVTRDELRQAVWRDETFVDFDRGLNFCIAQIRSALGDDATAPRYVKTVPKRGYEFICPVERDGPRPVAVLPAQTRRSPRAWVMVAALCLTVGGLLAGLAWLRRPAPTIVAVARFDNETGDPAITRFTDALSDAVVVQLASEGSGGYSVIGNASILRGSRDARDLHAIADQLHAGYVVLGQVQRDDTKVRVLAHLIRLPDQTHVSVSRTDKLGDLSLDAMDGLVTRIVQKFDARLRGIAPPAPSSQPVSR